MIRHAKFRNVPVKYSIKGKGRVVVLLHGFLEDLEMLSGIADQLSKSFRVVSIDLPGHGGTPVLGYVHSMELMADCVKAVLDQIGLRRYVIAGHSMGGYVALAFADKFNEHVAGLCLFHSTALADSDQKKKDRDRMAEVVRNDHKGFVAGLIPKLFAEENLKVLKHEVSTALKTAYQTSSEGVIAALRGMKERPPREFVLRNSTYPVLFIIGKKDSLLAWDNLMLLTSLPRKSYQLVLEHAGHMGFYEMPDKCLKMLRKFSYICYKSK